MLMTTPLSKNMFDALFFGDAFWRFGDLGGAMIGEVFGTCLSGVAGGF